MKVGKEDLLMLFPEPEDYDSYWTKKPASLMTLIKVLGPSWEANLKNIEEMPMFKKHF